MRGAVGSHWSGNFNPPIPCGMGRSDGSAISVDVSISIHPSRVGWDPLRESNTPDRPEFQSTHPVWDGTMRHLVIGSRHGISIHPSRVGWDLTTCGIRSRSLNFNPPIPCGMGRICDRNGIDWQKFQSTHPVWDGTQHTICLK